MSHIQGCSQSGNIAISTIFAESIVKKVKAMLIKIIKWSAIAGVMAGTFPPTTGDYALISKYIVVAASVIVLIQAVAMRRYGWMALFLLVACVFNPVFPVSLSSYFFGMASTFSALLFFFSLELLKPKLSMSITPVAGHVPGRESL
jgi:hypothetical protein